MKFLTRIGLVAFLLLSAGVTEAVPMAYEFTGVIDSVNDQDGLLDGSVRPQTEFFGRFTFDSSAQDLNGSPTLGRYSGPLFSMTLNVGSYSWFSGNGSGTLYVSNDRYGSDTLAISTSSFLIGGNLVVSTIGGGLSDSAGSMFVSDALPTALLPLSTLQSWFHVKGDSSLGLGFFAFGGTFTRFTVMPEPGAISLMLLGLLGIRRRPGASVGTD